VNWKRKAGGLKRLAADCIEQIGGRMPQRQVFERKNVRLAQSTPLDVAVYDSAVSRKLHGETIDAFDRPRCRH
jgi:hypothetical protein